jgi:copper resistance protein C
VIAASRPANDPANQQTVIVKFRHALPPGTYTVSWHMVSVYGRPSWGRFQFTVS